MAQSSPRGTYLKIADDLRARISEDPTLSKLPSLAELMQTYSVSRGVALRAYGLLREEGVVEATAGGRYQVRRGGAERRRPLADRVLALFFQRELKVGDPFLSASELSRLLDAARPTVAKALDKLEAAGLLSAGGQGKVRTVLALPDREEHSKP
ncbi:GntR family transcriptional regulator [Streptomyces sp. NPDC001941]|uniref:GntR family transcriptional regulator n=1 Tax=Streptomyces sp. NPDC001941 TaxID=3154659 RepID=UPI00331FA9C3